MGSRRRSKSNGKPTDLKAAIPLDQVYIEATKAVKPVAFVDAFDRLEA